MNQMVYALLKINDKEQITIISIHRKEEDAKKASDEYPDELFTENDVMLLIREFPLL
jgi:hypothetical protein